MKEESPLENVDPDEYLHDIEPNSPDNHATPTPPPLSHEVHTERQTQ